MAPGAARASACTTGRFANAPVWVPCPAPRSPLPQNGTTPAALRLRPGLQLPGRPAGAARQYSKVLGAVEASIRFSISGPSTVVSAPVCPAPGPMALSRTTGP